MQLGLRVELGARREPLAEFDAIDRLAVPEEDTRTVDRELNVVPLRHIRVARRTRQIELDRVREQRGRDDENHQQDEHYVDQRDDVDLGERRADLVVALIDSGECHYTPLPTEAAPRGGRSASTTAASPMRAPVASIVKSSFENA